MATQVKPKKNGKATGAKVRKVTEAGRQTVRGKATSTNLPSRALPDFGNNDTINVLATKNPHNAGTKEAERFDLFKTGMTVAECLETQKAKGFKRRRVAIRRAANIGHIRIEKS